MNFVVHNTSANAGSRLSPSSSTTGPTWLRSSFVNDASEAGQTEVPEGRYDNSPEPARNERRPGFGSEDDPLPFFWFGAPAGRRAKPEKGEGGVRVGRSPGRRLRRPCWAIIMLPLRGAGRADWVGVLRINENVTLSAVWKKQKWHNPWPTVTTTLLAL
jgi:hypothetical protein